MKKSIILGFVIVFLCSACYAQDKEKAKQYLSLYSKCDGKQIGKSLFMMSPEAFVKKIKEGKDIFVFDVRTKAEENIVAINTAHVLFVPMNKVFEESTLAKLPKDKPILVLCKMGIRSALVTMGLRDI